MKYAYTILYVEKVDETIAFYEKAFGFSMKFITPENDYAELESGETANFNEGIEKMALSKKPVGIELAFTSEEIEEDFAQAVDAGASVYQSIIDKPWGQKVGYLRDNNGFLIEICTPIKG